MSPASRALVLLAVATSVGVAGCSGGDSPTALHGTYDITYVVTGAVDAPVTISWTDPGTRDVSSTTVSVLPWARQFHVTDPDQINMSFNVIDSNNDTDVTCDIVTNGHVTTAATIHAGRTGECASVHL